MEDALFNNFSEIPLKSDIGKDFTPIRTGKTGFRSLAPIGKEFTPIRTLSSRAFRCGPKAGML
jgi:hypothetical protein